MHVLHLRTGILQSWLTFPDDLFVVLLLITQKFQLYYSIHSGSRGSALKEYHHLFQELFFPHASTPANTTAILQCIYAEFEMILMRICANHRSMCQH